MKLTPVIAALRARCPYFENRVAGAAQFKNLPEVGKLRLPAAYVVPGDDSPGENKSQTDYWQELKEGFSVVVILSNGRDERGQFASYDVVDDVRQMLFKALLGWKLAFFLLNRIHALVVLCFEVVKLLLQLLRDLFDIFNINRHRISPD